MAALTTDDPATASDASLYDDVPLDALAKLAKGNAAARLEWSRLLKDAEACERRAAESQKLVAAAARRVGGVGTAHAAAGAIADALAARAAAHVRSRA